MPNLDLYSHYGEVRTVASKAVELTERRKKGESIPDHVWIYQRSKRDPDEVIHHTRLNWSRTKHKYVRY